MRARIYACVRSVDIFLLHEHSLWEFLSLSFLPFSLDLFIVSHLPVPSCFAWVNSAGYSVGKVGSVGFQIIATQYIDPERHIDRCGRERNNNLHCYCEPIRRNQTGPARSPSCFPFPCILLSRCLAPLFPSLKLFLFIISILLHSLSLFLSFTHSFEGRINAFIDSLHSFPSFFTPRLYTRLGTRFVRRMSGTTPNMRMTSGNRLELIVSSATPQLVDAPKDASRR